MNPNVMTVAVALVCAVGGGFLGARLGAESPAAAAPAAVGPEAQGAAAIAALERRSAATERALEEVRLALADVASAQRSAVAARGAERGSGTTTPAAGPVAAPAPGGGTAIERILAGGLEWDEAQELWKEVEASGRLDELVKLLEERAAARGNDPEAQTQLGLAYLQKTFRSGGGPEAGVWATKADRAFDAALQIDDEHWEARFQKAVSLSFWPPMLGKQPDAVKQFETLVAQQEASGAKHKGYASTYLFLGNMHLQMGAKDKAIAAWNQGLAQFPDDVELQKKIADVH